MLYFGGYSPPAMSFAEYCDVYLMWPETEENLRDLMENMSKDAAKYKRKVDFGLRVHVIVREREEEAYAYAESIISKLDLEAGKELRDRALDANSYGVSRQREMRDKSSSDGYVEPNLWTGIGKARSGCGAALVGNPDQIIEKLQSLHGYGNTFLYFFRLPNIDECYRFADLVLPKLKTFQCLKNKES